MKLIKITLILLILWLFIAIRFFSQIISDTNTIKPVALINELHVDSSKPVPNAEIGVLLIVCNRLELIKNTVDQLIEIRESTKKGLLKRFPNDSSLQSKINLPLIVSQDCDSQPVTQFLSEYLKKFNDTVHARFPDQNKIIPLNKNEKRFKGYFHIARHYRWAIEHAFGLYSGMNMLIIVEDDLNISADFYEYFITLAPMLMNDSRLLCVSAWNDNGKKRSIDLNANSRLYLTDFFPGLGWMLKKQLWNEIKVKWPRVYWDDWLRHWAQRKDRKCIRPEISRTSTVGRKGISNGQYYEQHLKYIEHSKTYYPFYDHQKEILMSLEADTYEKTLLHVVYNLSESIHHVAMKHIDESLRILNKTYRVTYYNQEEFALYANTFLIMSDFKYGVPRTAYNGIVTCIFRGFRLFLAPPPTRKVYIT